MAALTSGWPCPAATTAMPALKSRNRLPSTSSSTQPRPRLTTSGYRRVSDGLVTISSRAMMSAAIGPGSSVRRSGAVDWAVRSVVADVSVIVMCFPRSEVSSHCNICSMAPQRLPGLDEAPLEEDTVALLGAIAAIEPVAAGAGSPDSPLAPGSSLSGRQLDVLFDDQLASRHLDHTARWLRAQGLGFYTIGSAGHESNAFVAAALRPTDPALLHYRSGGFYLARARQAGRKLEDGLRE